MSVIITILVAAGVAVLTNIIAEGIKALCERSSCSIKLNRAMASFRND